MVHSAPSQSLFHELAHAHRAQKMASHKRPESSALDLPFMLLMVPFPLSGPHFACLHSSHKLLARSPFVVYWSPVGLTTGMRP
jgi:hypothetical protein